MKFGMNKTRLGKLAFLGFVFSLLIFAFSLATCSGGSAGGDTATITISTSVNRAEGRATVSLEQLRHVITLSGPTGTQTHTIVGAGTMKATVYQGHWEIKVEGYLGDELYSVGSASADVKAGKNTNVSVQMTVVWAGGYNDGSSVTPPSFTVNVVMINDNGLGDSVTVTPAIGRAGAKVTLNYVLDNTDPYNEIVFGGVGAGITIVDSAGNSTRSYTIDPADADPSNNITITATFLHTSLTLDPIDFTDTTDPINKTYGEVPFSNPVDPASYSGYGAITYSSSVPAVATVNSSGNVTIIGAGSTVITADKAQSGIWAPSSKSYVLNVAKVNVTVSGLGASNKVYDGYTTATITGIAGATISGVLGSDDVTVASATGAFSDANVASGKPVTITACTLGGTHGSNYTVSPLPSSITADITQATGSAVGTPSVSGTQSPNYVTVPAVSLNTPSTLQTVKYAISTTSGITNPSSLTWYTSPALAVSATGTYYVYAYAEATTNYSAGAISESTVGTAVYSVGFSPNGGGGTFPTQYIVSGSTATQPSNPTGGGSSWSLSEGLYSGSSVTTSGTYTFTAWQLSGSNYTWSSPVISSINLSAVYNSSGPASAINTGGTGITDAITYLNNTSNVSSPSSFTYLFAQTAYSLGEQPRFTNPNVSLYLQALSSTTISLLGTGCLFRVGDTTPGVASDLTIGSNITLVGNSSSNTAYLVFVYQECTLTLNGGTIKDNVGGPPPSGAGGGVRVAGTFIMNSGSITGNSTVTSMGGGVLVENGGTFEMYGGNISDNYATGGPTYGLGGGVALLYSGSSFTMNGGTIMYNDASEAYGGVSVAAGTTFDVNLPSPQISITSNTAGAPPDNVGGGGAINVYGSPASPW